MNDVPMTPGDTGSLPPSWCNATIGDLAEYVSRGRAPSYVDESETPVINQRCIRWHGIEFDCVKYTDDIKAEKLADEQFLRAGDVLWNSTGTGTIGRATVFRPTARFGRAVVDTHVTIVRSNTYVPELLRYWIASAEVQNQIGEMQLGSTNQVELSRERVLNTLVPVPPLPEQQRIVAKIDELFSELDAGVASLKRARALLKKYRQAVLKAAVTGELTREWRERHQGEIKESGAELLQRILKARRQAWEAAELKKLRAKGKPPKDELPLSTEDLTGFPSLPDGWVWAPLGSLISDGPTNGYSPKSDPNAKGTLSLKLSATTQRRLVLSSHTIKHLHEQIPLGSKYWLEPGDLLVQRANSLEHVGATAIFQGQRFTYIYPDLMMRIRAKEPTLRVLLWRYLNSQFARNYFQSKAIGTAGNMPKINSEVLRRLPVPLPSPGELSAIEEHVAEASAIVDHAEGDFANQDARLRALRQSILKAAFAGRLVPQDPNDEPASVLLERIRAERAAMPVRGRRRQAGAGARQLELLG